MRNNLFVLQRLGTCVLVLSLYLTSFAQSIDLSGTWQFQIDREGKGVEEKWYQPDYQMNDVITLPASMPQQLKGDDISVDTKWVGSLYDSSYFYNPYMAKYRQPGKDMKLQFFLTPDKHYVGKAWYKKRVTLPEHESVPMYSLYLERPHITTEVWVNGEKEGYGCYRYADGSMYEGSFVLSQFEGEGTYLYKDGAVYIGHFHHGVRHGYGIYRTANGQVLSGHWTENCLDEKPSKKRKRT